MKPLIVITLMLLATVSFAQESTDALDWMTNLEKAKKISKKQDKPILVFFTGSDWCSPCKQLKKDFFESPEFASRADNMVLVMIDLPRRMDILTQKQLKYNKGVIAKYNPQKTFPKLLFLNYNGKVEGEMSGYTMLRDTSTHFAFVDDHVGASK